MHIRDALDLAQDEGLDLVEVGPNQDPPVCRLLDYGRFKFIQNKKQREARMVSRSASKQKDVRLSPVMSDNDVQTKINITKKLAIFASGDANINDNSTGFNPLGFNKMRLTNGAD